MIFQRFWRFVSSGDHWAFRHWSLVIGHRISGVRWHRLGVPLQSVGMAKWMFAGILVGFVFVARARGESVGGVPELPKIGERVFLVTDHGAVAGDGRDCAKAIQATIDAAAGAGGGIVDVAGGEFLSGPVQLADGINLRVEEGATLKMLPMDRYPGGTVNPQSFISGRGLHDIAISGKGTIDGQGAAWWPLVKTRAGIARPRMISLSGCEREAFD